MLKSASALTAALPVFLFLQPGCVRVQTDPIRIEPIYIEITVNHRVQEELDSLFAELDQASETTEYEPLDPEPEAEKE